jgi:two-component sensor histidine kinase
MRFRVAQGRPIPGKSALGRMTWQSLGSIRVRLLIALAIALLPVLLLGVIQSVIAFDKDVTNRRAALVSAAQRSAAVAEARITVGKVLLETLTPNAIGLQCAQRLSEVVDGVTGYANLIRFDAYGDVVCSAKGAPADPQRINSIWFNRLKNGDELVILLPRPGEAVAPRRSLLAAVRAERNGRFDGAMVAEILLDSLRPNAADLTLPQETEVALADSTGAYISSTNPEAFPDNASEWIIQAGSHSFLHNDKDAKGEKRVFAVSALVGDDLYAVLSTPSEGLWGWAQGNVLSSIVPPVLAFILALAAVWVVTEQVVIRWLHYLQRVAAIYARGRFSIRSKAGDAPPEIRELAETLDLMADAIVARDAALHESLRHKDDLMREIHHRVKNNLQIISSMVSMQQRALSDPAARSAMNDTRQRVAALALVYRALYQGPDLRQVDLGAFLEELTAQLVVSESFGGHAVRTRVEADELVIDPDKLAPLALFAVEAISNAQKHAFAGRGGDLDVLFRVRDEVASLEISNSGHADDAAPPVMGEGVGRTLMSAFSRQLGGKAEFSVNDRGGLTALLTFPGPERQYEIPAAQLQFKRNR